MEQRIFHGNFSPGDFAQALIGEFHRGNYRVQQLGNKDLIIIQIETRERPLAGGRTAISITLRKVEDGVAVQIGKQAWFGLAASLAETALASWRNPWGLLTRLDDLAQDLENAQLSDKIWAFIESTGRSLGASFTLSERLSRVACAHCLTANPVGESNCIACGAPLGLVQPITCQNCGFVLNKEETICPNCGKNINLISSKIL